MLRLLLFRNPHLRLKPIFQLPHLPPCLMLMLWERCPVVLLVSLVSRWVGWRVLTNELVIWLFLVYPRWSPSWIWRNHGLWCCNHCPLGTVGLFCQLFVSWRAIRCQTFIFVKIFPLWSGRNIVNVLVLARLLLQWLVLTTQILTALLSPSLCLLLPISLLQSLSPAPLLRVLRLNNDSSSWPITVSVFQL